MKRCKHIKPGGGVVDGCGFQAETDSHTCQCGGMLRSVLVDSQIERQKTAIGLLHNLATLHNLGAFIVLTSGDEIELTPEAIAAYLENQAERQQIAADEAHYGGDGPAGCYGPDDTKGTG